MVKPSFSAARWNPFWTRELARYCAFFTTRGAMVMRNEYFTRILEPSELLFVISGDKGLVWAWNCFMGGSPEKIGSFTQRILKTIPPDKPHHMRAVIIYLHGLRNVGPQFFKAIRK